MIDLNGGLLVKIEKLILLKEQIPEKFCNFLYGVKNKNCPKKSTF